MGVCVPFVLRHAAVHAPALWDVLPAIDNPAAVGGTRRLA